MEISSGEIDVELELMYVRSRAEYYPKTFRDTPNIFLKFF